MPKPWFEEINDVIEKRNFRCGLKGLGYIYNAPKNAFTDYKAGEDFESNNKFDLKKDCILPNRISNAKDKNNRYYNDINNRLACAAKSGIWSYKTVNRGSRFGRGNCWATEDDLHCAQNYEVPALIRRDRNIPDRDKVIKEAKDRCNNDRKCSWSKTSGQGFDCVRKSSVQDPGNNVMNPPPTMPKDVTKDGIEQYLSDWYLRKSPSVPPRTTPLFGEGDRCNPPKNAKGTNAGANVHVDPRSLNLLKKEDELTMRSIMETLDYPKASIDKRINEWKFIKDRPSVRFPDDPISDLATEYLAYLHDEEHNDEVDPYKGHAPSIPQSVVNMIMKHIAQTDSSNRGLMAIHSTGSGKTCCAAGVMDAFWDSKKQIVFASSIDAIASNPDYKFHECAKNLFPRFKNAPFKGETDQGSLQLIADGFQRRGISFLPFAKLANRIEKTEKFKEILFGKRVQVPRIKKIGGGALDGVEVSVGKRTIKRKPAVDENQEVPLVRLKKAVKVKVTSPKNDKPVVSRIGKAPLPRLGADMSRLLEYLTDLHPGYDNARIYDALKQVKISGFDDYVDLDHTCLIIDEVHNLFRPLPNQAEKHRYVLSHIADPKVHPSMKVVIMTATPGDSVQDIMQLINIVRDPTHPPVTPPDVESAEDMKRFKHDIRGLVSFFDMSNDTTKFPTVTDNGVMKYPMSTSHFEKYVEAYKGVKDQFKDYDTLAKQNQLAKYWQGARKYSNMLYNFEKGMKLTEFSSKLPALLDNIKKYPAEKQYVYSSFYENRGSSQGILAISKQLETMGYRQLTVKEAKQYYTKVKSGNDGGKSKAETKEVLTKMPSKGKRFILAIQKEIGEEGTTSAGRNLNYLIDIYNHPDNKNGDYVHMFLASQGFNEGIDLKGVRHIHFFEPLVTMASDLQTIGRARRYCSHSALDRSKGEWSVQIHRYLSDFPLTFKQSVRSQDTIQKQLEQLKEDLADLKKKEEEIKTLSRSQIVSRYGRPDYMKIIKSDIIEKTKELKNALGLVIKLKSESGTKMIDDEVHNIALQKMKELVILHQAIKDSAVDCRVLQKFHGSSTKQGPTCQVWAGENETKSANAKPVIVTKSASRGVKIGL
jgi:hypothetical protein